MFVQDAAATKVSAAMNSLISSVLTTCAAAAVAITVFGLPDFGPGVAHDEITGSINSDRNGPFSLESGGSSCSIRKGAQIAPTVYRLETSGGCSAVFDGFDTALYWTDTSRGGVVISGRNGPILEFAESDGTALESIKPTQQLLLLSPKSE